MDGKPLSSIKVDINVNRSISHVLCGFLFITILLLFVGRGEAYPGSLVGYRYWLANTETRVGRQSMLIQGFGLSGKLSEPLEGGFQVCSGNSRSVQIDLITGEFHYPLFALASGWTSGLSLVGSSTYRRDRGTGTTYSFQMLSPGLFTQWDGGTDFRLGSEVQAGVLYGSDGSGSYQGGVDYHLFMGYLFQQYSRLAIVVGYRGSSVQSTPTGAASFQEKVEGFYLETSMAL